jgi:hypothetical protein
MFRQRDERDDMNAVAMVGTVAGSLALGGGVGYAAQQWTKHQAEVQRARQIDVKAQYADLDPWQANTMPNGIGRLLLSPTPSTAQVESAKVNGLTVLGGVGAAIAGLTAADMTSTAAPLRAAGVLASIGLAAGAIVNAHTSWS